MLFRSLIYNKCLSCHEHGCSQAPPCMTTLNGHASRAPTATQASSGTLKYQYFLTYSPVSASMKHIQMQCGVGGNQGGMSHRLQLTKGEQFAKLHKEICGSIEVNFKHLVLIRPGYWDRPRRYVPSEHFKFYKQPIFSLPS